MALHVNAPTTAFQQCKALRSFKRINGPASSLTSWKPAIICFAKTTNQWLLPSETSRLQVFLYSLQPHSAVRASLQENQAVCGLYHKGVHAHKAKHSGRHETHQLLGIREQTIHFSSVSKQLPLYSTVNPGPGSKQVPEWCTLHNGGLPKVNYKHLEWSKEVFAHCH